MLYPGPLPKFRAPKPPRRYPHPPTRLLNLKINYGSLFKRLISLPAEIQIMILRPLLTFPTIKSSKVRPILCRIYKPWLLVHKTLAPQVMEVFWKENIFPLVLKYNSPPAQFAIPAPEVGCLLRKVIFTFWLCDRYPPSPEIYKEHLEYLMLLGDRTRYPALQYLELLMAQRETGFQAIFNTVQPFLSQNLHVVVSWDTPWGNQDMMYPATVEGLKNQHWERILSAYKQMKLHEYSVKLKDWQVEVLVRRCLVVGEEVLWEEIWERVRRRYEARFDHEGFERGGFRCFGS